MAVGLAAGLFAAGLPQIPDPLPRPDGKPADLSKPVQVYILMGQSNMLGFGKPKGLADACKNKGLYPYLIDENGDWTVRKDVRYVRVMCSGSGPSKTHNNEWMTIKGKIGPEMGIGHYVGHVTKAPVLILKSCIGNRSLGYDLLPPSAEGYAGDPNPARRPKSGPWYAGVQYDGDTAAAKKVLANLSKYYPGAKRYEVAGFFWWQGDKDFRNNDHANNYEKNLLCLIESLRKDFKAPNAKFVCASLGQTRKGAGGNQGKILEAILNIDGERGKYPKHKGKVASVYSHPLSKGGSSSGHYGGNAETYMNVGQAMGLAMAKLILKSSPGVPAVNADELEGSLRKVHKLIVTGKLNQADKAMRQYLAAASSKRRDQLANARKIDEHLKHLVQGSIDEMQGFGDSGDYCQLRDALAKNSKTLPGIPAYDRRHKDWAAQLLTKRAMQEMAIGDKLQAIIGRKSRSNADTYYGLIAAFQKEHPDSFYTRKAEAEIAPIRAALGKVLDSLRTYGQRGDLYAKSQAFQEASALYAKIPEFKEAKQRWTAEAKDRGVQKAIAAGKAYSAIFEEVAKLNARLAKSQAKTKKITGKKRRAKAEEKALASHRRKLKVLASKLEKLAARNADSYYGKAAAKSLELYTKSDGQRLTNQLGK